MPVVYVKITTLDEYLVLVSITAGLSHAWLHVINIAMAKNRL